MFKGDGVSGQKKPASTGESHVFRDNQLLQWPGNSPNFSPIGLNSKTTEKIFRILTCGKNNLLDGREEILAGEDILEMI